MPDVILALVRTLATLLIGATLTALANLARRELGLVVEVDETTKVTLISGVSAFISMLWYATFATLERRWPAFGVFLGWPKAPHYEGTPDRWIVKPLPEQRVVQADADVTDSEENSQRKGYPLKD